MKLLHIDAGITGDNSVSRQLSGAIVEALAKADPGLEIRLDQSGRMYLDIDLAIGLQMVTGLQPRSKLLDPTVPLSVSGAQGMAEFRGGVGFGYRFTPELAAYSSLSQSSSPKKQHFFAEIQRVEWMFGLAYRF